MADHCTGSAVVRPAIRRVGFIGLGNMGSPMAGHLVRAGFEVTGYDLREEAVAAFARDGGGNVAGTAAEAARGAEALITMLPDHNVVREVLLGPGVLEAMAEGAVAIDMSTSDPMATRSLAEALAGRGIPLVDAPVMGGVVFARDGSLDILAGGANEEIVRLGPIFNALGRSLIACGPVGAGHALKVLANYVNACALATGIEALTIGRRYGLDSELMARALVPLCAGRNHPIEKKILPHVLTRRYGTGMSVAFIAKDVEIARETAERLDAHAPLATLVAELWSRAAERLGASADQTEIVRYWEDETGVRL
jgi:3-hydroxyisobutyrate dehydrogenase